MHYQLEVVLPPMPVENIYEHLQKILETWSEEYLDEYEDPNPNAFWDWWVIGGRFSGTKLVESLDQEQVNEFYQKLDEMKVMVSAVQAGKQRLMPQFEEPVDALWREMFPDSGYHNCPLFAHSNDQYAQDEFGAGDVMRLGDIQNQDCYRLIIVEEDKHYSTDTGEFTSNACYRIGTMYATELWNGANFQKAEWNGGIREGVNEYLNSWRCPKADSAKAHMIPNDDWLVVTVDYHC